MGWVRVFFYETFRVVRGSYFYDELGLVRGKGLGTHPKFLQPRVGIPRDGGCVGRGSRRKEQRSWAFLATFGF